MVDTPERRPNELNQEDLTCSLNASESDALIILGCYLVIRALQKIHYYDRMILQLKACHSKLSIFID